MTLPAHLTPEQIEAAWKLAYRRSLDDHPNSEIRWEAGVWRALENPAIAEIADDLLAERRAADFDLPGGADAPDLDRLLHRVDILAALPLCRDEALCLLAAVRLVFWNGLSEVPR